MEGRGVVQARVGRRRSTSRQQITDVAIALFAGRGFDEVSVDDVAEAAGIARRTLFRYYPSKNAIPWGDFDAHLQQLRGLLAAVGPAVPMERALRDALLAFNTFDESELPRHRLRMRVILQTTELQAYSMTMYAGWREVVAEFVAATHRTKADDLVPQTVAWAAAGRLAVGVRILAGRRVGVADRGPHRRVRRDPPRRLALALPVASVLVAPKTRHRAAFPARSCRKKNSAPGVGVRRAPTTMRM